MAAERSGNPPAPAPPPSPSFWRRNLTWLIFLPFFVLSMLVLGLSYRGYWFAHEKGLYDAAAAKENWPEAIARIQAILKRTPPEASADWLGKLGDAYRKLGRYREALDQYLQLKRLRPSTIIPAELMECYYEVGEEGLGQSIRDYLLKNDKGETSPEANERRAAANYYLGRDLLKKGLYADAGKAFRLAGTVPIWDERAKPWRKQLAEKVFGPEGSGNQTGAAMATQTGGTTTSLRSAGVTSGTQTNDHPTTGSANH